MSGPLRAALDRGGDSQLVSRARFSVPARVSRLLGWCYSYPLILGQFPVRSRGGAPQRAARRRGGATRLELMKMYKHEPGRSGERASEREERLF